MRLLKPVKGEGSVPDRAVRMDAAFGGRLKQAMVRRGVRPAELAKALEVGQGTVSRWRRGECPSDLRLEKIAGYLRVSGEWLMRGVGEIETESKAPGSPVEARSGDRTAPRSSVPGRRREDIELRAAAIRHAAGRLDVIARLIQAYRDAGRPASPDVLAEWLDILASDVVNGFTPLEPPAEPGSPSVVRPLPPGDGPGRP
jgi:transcriptional regulator with XRE-family HTH domain